MTLKGFQPIEALHLNPPLIRDGIPVVSTFGDAVRPSYFVE